MKLKPMISAALIVAMSVFGTSSAVTASQEIQYRIAHANGQGTLKVGQEQFKVTAVVAKLLDDKKVELTLISDITIFVSGTWTQNGESQEEFDLQITGGASPGGLEGTGKLTLGKDTKDLKLIVKGKSTTTKKNIEVYFVSK
jgi:hypothetical protein